MPDAGHTGLGRRAFLKAAGVLGVAAGCSPKAATQKVIPFLVPPEDIIPGVPLYYRTVCRECPAGCGVTARTREGRAVKLEGNPEDPIGRGALCARGQTGRGQCVTTSMVGATLGFLNSSVTEYLATGKIPGPTTRPRGSQTYAVVGSDGLPLAIHLSSPPKFWEGLCRALSHPELIDDPRFKTRIDRRRNYDELQQTLAAIMKEKPRSYWLEKLEAEDVPHTPVYNFAEVLQDPHIKHMGMEIEILREKRAPIRTVRFPIDYSETKIPHPAPPPDLGEHNLKYFKPLGWDEKALADLKEKGVI